MMGIGSLQKACLQEYTRAICFHIFKPRILMTENYRQTWFVDPS